MLEVKQGVARAIELAKDLFAGHPLNNLLLEEVEWVDDDNTWLITLGFDRPMAGPILRPDRVFKKFAIDADTGKLQSMKMR